MRKALVTCLLMFISVHNAYSQNVEGFLSLDSSVGFTSNTFLSPMINEWDRSARGGFASISPSGQLLWNSGSFSGNISSGFMYQPMFDERENWTGFYGNSNVRYRITPKWTAEIQGSASRFSSIYDRNIYSLFPTLTWSPGFFTRVRARAGSSFRNYSGLETADGGEISDRLDLYGLEFETWPSFNWRIRAGLNGNFAENPVQNHTLSFSLDRVIKRNWRLSLQTATDRYSTEVVTTTGGTGGGGSQPPIGGPGGGEEIVTEEDSDRLIRAGLSISRTLFDRLTVSASVSHVSFLPAEQESISDVQTTLRFQYSLPVSGLMRNRSGEATPNWSDESEGVVFVTVDYRGDGDLYLVGEFNDWERPGIPLSKQTNRRYAVELDLEPGIYEYKILRVEGGEEEWIDFSNETMTVNDGFGGENGLIYID